MDGLRNSLFPTHCKQVDGNNGYNNRCDMLENELSEVSLSDPLASVSALCADDKAQASNEYYICCDLIDSDDINGLHTLYEEGASFPLQVDENGNTLLHKAAMKGNIKIFSYLSTRLPQIEPDSKNTAGKIALHLAVLHNHLPLASYILTHTKVTQIRDNLDRTSLLCAVHMGNTKMATLLLSHGSNLNERENYIHHNQKVFKHRKNPLHKRIQCVKKKPPFDTPDYTTPNCSIIAKPGKTCLTIAVEKGHIEMVSFLLSRGCSLSDKSSYYSLVCSAARCNDLQMIKLLVAQGCSLEETNRNGESSLIIAAGNGNFEITQYLLSQGCSITKMNKFGWSSLIMASREGQLEMVKFLITQGSSIHENALIHATEKGHIDIVEFLISKGSLIDEPDLSGQTSLHIACENDDFEMVRYLIAHGSCLNSKTQSGMSCLHFAVKNGNLEMVQLLTSCPSFKYESNHVIDASEIGNLAIVQHLLTLQGCSIHENNFYQDCYTPLLAATIGGHIDVIKYLVSQGASVNEKTRSGKSCLSFAVFEGNMALVQFFMDQGCIVDDENLLGASKKGHLEIVKFLISAGCCMDVEDESGRNSFSCAVEGDHVEVAKYLLSITTYSDFQLGSLFTDPSIEMLEVLFNEGCVDVEEIQRECNEDHFSAFMQEMKRKKTNKRAL